MNSRDPEDFEAHEVDRRFEELTAGWEAELPGRDGEPGLDGSTEQDAPDEVDSDGPPAQGLQIPAQWRTPTGPSFLEDNEPDFVPPEPEPLPQDEMFWVTLALLVVGPLWFLYLFFFDRYAATLWWVLALTMSFAGVAMLVLRQPRNREHEDPDDDGARL